MVKKCAFFLVFQFMLISLSAQTGFINNPGFDNGISAHQFHALREGNGDKKWFFSKSIGLTAGYSSFMGGFSTLSIPVGLQLNRRLTNSLYAFAGASVSPAFGQFRQAFTSTGFQNNHPNTMFQNRFSPGNYSRAELGLMYVNDDRTFSISGSIGIERNAFPVMPVHRQPVRNAFPVQQ